MMKPETSLAAAELDADDTFSPQGPAPLPSKRPALVVLGIVALVSVGGFILALAGTHRGGSSSKAPVGHLKGVALTAQPARALLAPVVSPGQPPRDILDHLVVPSGARRNGAHCQSGGVSLYDCQVRLSLSAPPSQVVGFFSAALRHEGWSKLAKDATVQGNGTELLAQRASSDGFYWEVGVVVDPVNPSITPALAGGSEVAPTSSVELRVFEVDGGD